MVEHLRRLFNAVCLRGRSAALAHNTREIEQRLGDAAEFAPAHRRRLFGRDREDLIRRPVAEAQCDLKRLVVSTYLRLVDKSLENLMLHVPRSPDAHAGDDLVDVRRGERADPACADRVLAALQFRHGDCGARFYRRVTSSLVERGHAGEPMSEGVSAKLHVGLLPSAGTLDEVGIGDIVKPCRDPKHPREVHWVERLHDRPLALHVFEKRPRQEPNDRRRARGKRVGICNQDY